MIGKRAPSVESLLRDFGVTAHTAKAIRAAWKGAGKRHERREAVDTLLQTCGVEYLGKNRRSGAGVYYCNAGDAYSPTLLFHGDTLTIGCWGSLAESRTVATPRFYGDDNY